MGTGTFAAGICASLAQQLCPPATLTVAARSPVGAQALADATAIRASSAGVRLAVGAETISLISAGAAAEFVARQMPDVVVHVVSSQSPSELHGGASAWTDLVREAGLGVTLPLQAVLAARLAVAVVRAWPQCLFVNAAYPDSVNPVLRQLGLPVFCGLGNVAVLDAAVRAKLSLTGESDLRIIGHHCHLSAIHGVPEARAWVGGRELPDVTALLASVRALPRAVFNSIAATSAGAFLCRLVADEPFSASVPGPNGLPGGYPVTVSRREISVDLPGEITVGEAVALNEAWSGAEGAWVTSDGKVHFSEIAAGALARHGLRDIADGFAVADLEGAAADLADLRETLRSRR